MGKQHGEDQPSDMQGEGDRRSARRYNENLDKAREQGDLEGRDPAPESQEEAEEYERAEEKGKSKAKEYDPQVHRDWSEPEKD